MKGIIVAAGYGTRFLPVTRCVPKEMLPLVDRPSLDFVVSELAEAGVDRILVISSRRKRVLENWFDRDAELDAVFAAEGAVRKARLAEPPAVQVTFLRQREMRGTGHAMLLARDFAAGDPVVVAYPDDLFVPHTPGAPNCTAQLVAAYEETGCSVLSAHDLSGRDVSRYGVLDATRDGERFPVRALVEKPAPGAEPSHLVSLGRYLFTPELFPLLAADFARHGEGEFFPQDAINTLAAAGKVVAQVVDARRWDTGTPLGLLKASVEHALSREDVGPELRAWLRAVVRSPPT